MKRALPVLLAVLLGAFAAALGMGVFLKLANDDRSRLADEIDLARGEATAALADKERIANEANKKVSAANDEVAKAQQVLRDIENERVLLADAKQLLKPPSRDTRSWTSAVSLPLGVILLLPPGTHVESNDMSALTSALGAKATTSSRYGYTDKRWLSLTPYNKALESELIGSLATSTPRSYLVDGRLLMGQVGTVNGSQERLSVFRIRETASSTHLLWIKDPGILGAGNGVERLLGTLEFAN